MPGNHPILKDYSIVNVGSSTSSANLAELPDIRAGAVAVAVQRLGCRNINHSSTPVTSKNIT